MKTIIYAICSIILVASFAACTKDFEEINKNPNQPDQVDRPELLLTSVLKTSMKDYYYASWTRGNVVSDHNAYQYVTGFDNAWAPSQLDGYFLWNFYNSLRDVENFLSVSRSKDMKANIGVGLVMKSWLYQVLTDIYGDIPYSEAIKGKSEDVYYPKYDTQESIYYSIIDSLETANTLLKTNENIGGDILFSGNRERWQMFANGLQLRMLLRISSTTGVKIDVPAKMQKIASDPANYPLFKSFADQASFNFLSESGNEISTWADNPSDFDGSRHFSLTFETVLKGLNDPRLYLFACPTPNSDASGVHEYKGEYKGVPNGITAEADKAYGGDGGKNQSPPGLLWAPRSYSTHALPDGAQNLVLTYSEVQFILAEARERGLINVGSAAEYYENGIKDQFLYYQSRIARTSFVFPTAADIAIPASYLTQTKVAYTGTQAEKVEKILIQKWIGFFNCGFEAWSEWRRTGYPQEIKAGPNSSISEYPRRSMYPNSEKNQNEDAYKAAVAIQGPDLLTTHIWWNK